MDRNEPVHLTTQADLMRAAHAKVKDDLQSPEKRCRAIAQKALDDFGAKLPPTRSFELYLVQGVSGKDVIFPPEFIFLLDVGLDAAVGVSVYWQAHGRGDPDFPDFSAATLRSVLNRSSTGIIFPKIAGELMIVVKTGYKDSDVKAGLEAEGLKNVQGSDFFWTGNCQPFIEQSLCKKLEADLPFVKSAEQNGVARIVDFGPGWSCVRLA